MAIFASVTALDTLAVAASCFLEAACPADFFSETLLSIFDFSASALTTADLAEASLAESVESGFSAASYSALATAFSAFSTVFSTFESSFLASFKSLSAAFTSTFAAYFYVSSALTTFLAVASGFSFFPALATTLAALALASLLAASIVNLAAASSIFFADFSSAVFNF